MSNVVGIASFGLCDAVCSGTAVLAADDGRKMSCALLPDSTMGAILTGADAEHIRRHTGLYWPDEARLPVDTPVLRAPEPVLWRALVESGDMSSAWQINGPMDLPIGHILAHSTNRAYSAALQQDAGTAAGDGILPQPVIAIPDSLDERGQEDLQQGWITLKRPMPLLIWRPVAAALAWLEAVKPLWATEPTGEAREHIHVLYFGLDALEWTTLRLRRWEHQGKDWLIPRRERPATIPSLTGFDWGAAVAESYSKGDKGAFWQLFTGFPEIWDNFRCRDLEMSNLPRPWSRESMWDVWFPGDNSSFFDKNVCTHRAAANGMLRAILSQSYRLRNWDRGISFQQAAAREVRGLLKRLPLSALQGVIVCGPLVPDAGTPGMTRLLSDAGASPRLAWLQAILTPLREAGLKVCSDRAEPGGVWLAPGHGAIARGAAIYGERRAQGIPAYLDTMPQVSLLAETKGLTRFYPLLDSQEVLGGETFAACIEGKFQLARNRKEVQFILRKGSTEPSGLSPGLTECQARFVRFWVRQRTVSTPAQARAEVALLPSWARGYAEELLLQTLTASNDQDAKVTAEQTPYRKNSIEFPSAPEQDLLLDVHVEMKPAAGQASVLFKPQNPKFMNGRSIRMNYNTMTPTRLPNQLKAWPDIDEMAAHPEDAVWNDTIKQYQLRKFQDLTIKDRREYQSCMEEIKQDILKTKYKYQYDEGRYLFMASLTEQGTCCTEKGSLLLEQLRDKVDADFTQARKTGDETLIKTMCSHFSWMYGATPDSMHQYLRDCLKSEQFTSLSPMLANTVMEAASKCFATTEDLKAVFDAVMWTANQRSFTIFCVRSASRPLRFRKDAVGALTDQTAESIAEKTFDVMKEQASKPKYSTKFFQCTLLLTYLLRYREKSTLFSPDYHIFHKAEDLLTQAVTYTEKYDKRKTQRVKAALEDFRAFVEQRALGGYPQAIIDLADPDGN